jgi:hypothetical protein
VKKKRPDTAKSQYEPVAIIAIEINTRERAAIQKMGLDNFGLFFRMTSFGD